MEFSFRYNRKAEVFEQVCGIFRGFRYGNVNERTIHIIANKEMGIPLTMTNYVNDLMTFDEKGRQERSAAAVPMFTAKQRHKYFMTFSPDWIIVP